jgi:tetratricopeptide (TPR) repeat protein
MVSFDTAARQSILWLGMAALAAAPACREEAAHSAATPETTASADTAKAAPTGPAWFVDVTEEVGITHVHRQPTLDPKVANIASWLSSVGAAAATADFDGDGWLDLYVTDSERGRPNHLYRNNGDGTFTNVAAKAGLADLNGPQGASMDCVWGDYNNDGRPDLYLVRWGNDSLFRNNGDGTFAEVTGELFRKRDGSPGMEWANGNAAVWLDYNLDGRLDVYVGNYFKNHDLWDLETTEIMHDDFEQSRNGGRNALFRQNADGTFTDVAPELGLDDPGWTLSVGSGDVNNDGWPDIYVADDFGPDQLFINLGGGTFENATEYAVGFDTKKGMNAEFGDFNNDGWLDIYVTNITTDEYLKEGNMLWYNNGPGPDGRVTFTDMSVEAGAFNGGWGWGAKFFDYDNDGDLDIVSLNGFISAGAGNYWYDLATWTVEGVAPTDATAWPPIGDRSFSGHEKTRLWRNDTLYTFTERAVELGIDDARDGRGAVVFDYDNDGDLDLFVANQNDKPNFYRNDGAARDTGKGVNHWLGVKLVTRSGLPVNRDGIGARVSIVTAGGRQIRERDGGNGYSGQSDPRLFFGLRGESKVDLLEVRWPDGGLQYVENVAADRYITIEQDPAQYADRVAIAPIQPTPRAAPDAREVRVAADLDPAKIEQLLGSMEEKLRAAPDGWSLGSAYRARCAEYALHDRAIKFFEKVAADHGDHLPTQVQFSCTYVDKIPTCGGIAAVVSKGTLANNSLKQLNRVLERHPDLWVGYYCRAMNHLHWPKSLGHSDDAADDFRKCIDLQAADAAGPAARPHYVRAHVGLGDALTKDKEYAKAREAWRTGLTLFPDHPDLLARLATEGDDAQLDFVESHRSLEAAIDTDLSFLDH